MTEKPRMLVVDDDAVIRELMDSYFTAESFDVITRPDGKGCPELVVKNDIDICLVDIKLPGQDGLEVTHDIRALSEVGIILVTSKDDLVDRIVGLESGADDYVTKPFEMRELLSRVKNILRRSKDRRSAGVSNSTRTWNFHDWVLDVNKRILSTPDEENVSLSEGEFQLLLTMVENSGRIMSRNELMRTIRNRDWQPDDRYVDVLVVKLRQKFKRKSPDLVFITTVHGTGYLFEPEATPL